MIARALHILLVLFNITFAALSLYFIFKGGVVTPDSQGLEYKDFISILLTGLGLMMAVAAFFVAIVALWGYKEGKVLIAETAEKVARAEIRSHLPVVLRKNPELILEALKQEPGLLVAAVRENENTLFGDVDSEEAAEIVEALDDGQNDDARPHQGLPEDGSS